MHRTTTALVIAVCLALAGCSSSGSDDKPSPTVTKTVTASPSLSEVDARQACVDAWAQVIDSRSDDFDTETDEDPQPAECAGLSGQSDLYMEGLRQRNQAARDELGECLDDPSCTSVPIP